MIAAIVYGDALMLLENQVKPYEVIKGDSHAMVKKWTKYLSEKINKGDACSIKQQKEYLHKLTADFASIPVKRVPKVKVGIVGEIYVKYAPFANNHLEDFLAEQQRGRGHGG